MTDNKFQHLNLTNIDALTNIINIFVKELAIEGDKLQIANDLLKQLFQLLSFDFNHFLASLRLSKAQTSHYVSYLLYSLYYYEFPLIALKSINEPSQVNHFLLALLAESLEQKEVRTIIKSFPQGRQLHLACYCALFSREGTRSLLNILASFQREDPEWQAFFKHLRTKYYSAAHLQRTLAGYPQDKAPSLSSLINALDKHADEQILDIMLLLPSLIKDIVHSPLSTFEMLRINNLSNDIIRESTKQVHEYLEDLFKKYRQIAYSIEEMRDFFRNFGLQGHVLNNFVIKNPAAMGSLIEILKKLSTLYQTPWQIPVSDSSSMIPFVHSLCVQLYAYHQKKTSPYIQGLQSIVFALSTRGDQLTKSPWLHSVLEGLDIMTEHLQTKSSDESSSYINPFVIFDQATHSIYKKNNKALQELAKEHQAPIWHLSKAQTLQLAQKLGIASWIKTSSTHFGYGGARNCALLLAPVLTAAFRHGKRNIEEVLQLSESELHDLSGQAVLGKNHHDYFIHLGEDDVAIPIGNIFLDAMCAYTDREAYASHSTECRGRNTQKIYPLLDFKTILETPSQCFFNWSNALFYGSMKGMLTKPKFCLPVPLGNEELQVNLPKIGLFHFHQANEHLAGTRFPHKNMPLSPWDGLLNSLKIQVPYRFHISMSSVLTDPSNKYLRNIFPWNDAAIKTGRWFHSLGDLWKFASSPVVTQELRNRFWNNVETLFQPDNSQLLFRKTIDGLINVDFAITASPKFSDLKDFYKSMQREAQFFVAFAHSLLVYRAKGTKNYVQKAKAKVEAEFGLKISRTSLPKGFLALVEAIENFGKMPIVRVSSSA